MKKTFLLSLLALIALFTIPALSTLSPHPAHASEISIIVDNTTVLFSDQYPLILDGRTLVPVRGVFELMGFDVQWDEELSLATLTGADVVKLRRGEAHFWVNDEMITPEVPPHIRNGRFMLPLRAIAEATGAEVEWEEETSTIYIYSPDNINYELADAESEEEEAAAPAPAGSYTITTVSSNTAQGTASPSRPNAAQGQTVTVTATAKAGFTFSRWEIQSGNILLANPNAASTTFTMGSANVRVRAVFTTAAPQPRSISVSANVNGRGTASASVATATHGQTVSLTANAAAGNEFSRWEILAGEVIIADTTSRTTTFVMGTINVRIRAVFLPTQQQQQQQQTPSLTAAEFEQRVFTLTNQERQSNGLEPLIWHDLVALAARNHSQDLVANNLNGHQGSDGSSARERLAAVGITHQGWAENVFRNQLTPEATVQGWLNSTNHRNNILNPNLKYMGIGVAINAAGRYTTTQKIVNIAESQDDLQPQIFAIIIEANNAEWGSVTSSAAEEESGSTVSISATPADDCEFEAWEIAEGDITLADPTDTSTTFVVGSSNVRIVARFRPVGGYVPQGPDPNDPDPHEPDPNDPQDPQDPDTNDPDPHDPQDPNPEPDTQPDPDSQSSPDSAGGGE